MERILYIGDNVSKISSGADSVNKRNFSFLNKLFRSNLYFLELKQNSYFDFLKGYAAGLNSQLQSEIISFIQENEIAIVFISHSMLGRLAKAIKQSNSKVKIISFYHNIEQHYAKEYLKSKGIKAIPLNLLAKYNESRSAKYSDVNIVLNNRDFNLFENLYQKKPDYILPVGYEDQFDVRKVVKNRSGKFTILFVGVAFFANTTGIKWFIDKVLPYVDVHLNIVGSGMDKYFESLNNENVSVYGFCEDLSKFYYDTDIVIAPIFEGGGMKTKIAEALMYGKIILGTKEAFVGYDILDKTTILFRDAEDCVQIINGLEKELGSLKFNDQSRSIFLKDYSNEALYENFRKIVEKLFLSK